MVLFASLFLVACTPKISETKKKELIDHFNNQKNLIQLQGGDIDNQSIINSFNLKRFDFEYSILWKEKENKLDVSNDPVVFSRQEKDQKFTLVATIIYMNNEISSFEFPINIKGFVHSVTYELNGGTNHLDNLKTFDERNENILHQPTKENYVFDGWYLEETFVNKVENLKGIQKDIKLFAKYNLKGDKEYIEEFKKANLLIFKENEDITNVLSDFKLTTIFHERKVLYQSDSNFIEIQNDKVLVKRNYKDETVKIVSKLYNKENMLLATKEIEIKLIKTVQIFNITYHLNGGVNHPDNKQTFTRGIDFELKNPTKNGFNFLGWYLDDNFQTKVTIINETFDKDIDLYAKYDGYTLDDYQRELNNKEILIFAEGDNENSVTKNFKLAERVLDLPLAFECYHPQVEINGYNVKITQGFSNEEVEFVIKLKVKETNLSVSKFFTIAKKELKKFNITYHLNGGINNSENPSFYLEDSEVALKAPTKENHVFAGWYLESTFVNEIKFIKEGTNKDIDLYAKFVSNDTKFIITKNSEYIILEPNNSSYKYNEKVTVKLNTPEGKKVIYLKINGNDIYQKDVNSYNIVVKENIDIKLELGSGFVTIAEAVARANDGKELKVKAVVTGILNDGHAGTIYYIQDETRAIELIANVPEIVNKVQVGDLCIFSVNAVTQYEDNGFTKYVLYPLGSDTCQIISRNTLLPEAIEIFNFKDETINYKENISKLFVVKNFKIKTTISFDGFKGLNVEIYDEFDNKYILRIHKYLENEKIKELEQFFKDLTEDDTISLENVHLTGFKYKQKPAIKQFMITSGTVITKTTDPNIVRHDVTFKLLNTEADVIISVVHGKKIPESKIPTPYNPGYILKGWNNGSQVFDVKNEVINNDIILTAIWEKNENPNPDPDPSDPSIKKYYASINLNDTNYSNLYVNLKNLVSQKSPIGYDQAKSWLLEADIDMSNRNRLRGIYDGVLFARKWDGASTWNREHVWPQSFLKPAGVDIGEAHNLRVSGTKINSNRGNKPFADATGPGYKNLGSTWFPSDRDKGDVARILMFMNLRHGLPLSDMAKSVDILLKWHTEDPIDDFERQRNKVIHKWQGNRNPYIDFPNLLVNLFGVAKQRVSKNKLIKERQLVQLHMLNQTRFSVDLSNFKF